MTFSRQAAAFTLALVFLMASRVHAEEIETVDVVVDSKESFQSSTQTSAMQPAPMPGDTQAGLWNADPFAILDQMEKQMAAMHGNMNAMFAPGMRGGMDPSMFNVGSQSGAYKYTESEDQIILTCAIPNAVQSSLDFNVDNNMVALQGVSESTNQKSNQNDQGQYQFYSSTRSSFYKQFPLHPEADPDEYKIKTNPDEVVITFKRRKGS